MIKIGDEVICQSSKKFIDGKVCAVVPANQEISQWWSEYSNIKSEERYFDEAVKDYPQVIVETLMAGKKKYSAIDQKFVNIAEDPFEYDDYLNIIAITSPKTLEIILNKYNVGTESYGFGTFKSIDELWDEINKGESSLKVTKQSKLIRLVKAVNIFVHSPDQSKMLYEQTQQFGNGHSRARANNFISEKANKNETFGITTAIRAIKEELGFDVNPIECELNYIGYKTVEADSASYPGLNTIQIIKTFNCVVPIYYYNSNGYEEVQDTKTTTFVWKKV